MAMEELQGRLDEAETHWVFAGNRVHDVDAAFPVQPPTIVRRGFTPHQREKAAKSLTRQPLSP
jgi:hypothetical protein